MPRADLPLLQPRKTPVQARSAASVEAILDATLQVLARTGSERLTTTRVAARAGVSVGTLYQYFPNKKALLQAALQRHMRGVGEAIEQACVQHRGADLSTMADGLCAAYLAAKMRNPRQSAMLYAISADLDGASIRAEAAARSRRAIGALFATAREGLSKDPGLVAECVLAALSGVVRQVLEAAEPEQALQLLRDELRSLIYAYLQTCTPPRVS